MEEIREAALAYYENGSEEQKQLARELFNSLDVNGDGTVSVHEYTSILSEMGYGLVINNSSFFQELDRDGNGSLDFDEFITLYYILKSPRPFCHGCRIFLKGLFFTCIQCHESSPADDTFDLCSACYRQKNFSHPHDVFLDNYALLASKRRSPVAVGQPDTTGQPTSSKMRNFIPKPLRSISVPSSGKKSSSPKPQRSSSEKANQAFEAFDAAVSVGSTFVNACTSM